MRKAKTNETEEQKCMDKLLQSQAGLIRDSRIKTLLWTFRDGKAYFEWICKDLTEVVGSGGSFEEKDKF